ncbi:head-to-tail adaptor [Mycobacterium phage Edugator]|uniref:Head-to-tail adaptor n=4 Tax=Kratiovirus larva TaxID=1056831 RepID=A0A221J738_9CAUD|nr:head-to-tail adaptor [Mycobacterium phage Larva]ASM62518.1 head-to-tail adaptor [Mycobacterium phage AlleyCat]ASR85709.1 head-to-tail adaptor [Mycobacterium phage Edugator]QQV92617.1 head-to-tail adaptor [Mycobacterium phage Psycho]WAB09693.1 head-to-tail adaptor [Mycobacterium phage Dadosky]AEL19667.1 head-to-tail adaptor [Mycobacterium phage Larva]
MLATLDDLTTALKSLNRPELAEGLEAAGVADLLERASDLVAGYLYPSTVPEPTPAAITRVTAEAAALAMIRPAELPAEAQTLQADGFGVTFAAGGSSPGPYLTAALKQRLRPYRSTMVSVSMGGELY